MFAVGFRNDFKLDNSKIPARARPVFAARMLPKTWISELNDSGGYAMILKYQLCPWTHTDLAKRVAQELGLPVDAPRAVAEGTMDRFQNWHRRHL